MQMQAEERRQAVQQAGGRELMLVWQYPGPGGGAAAWLAGPTLPPVAAACRLPKYLPALPCLGCPAMPCHACLQFALGRTFTWLTVGRAPATRWVLRCGRRAVGAVPGQLLRGAATAAAAPPAAAAERPPPACCPARQLRKGGMDVGRVRRVFVTHMHGDHCFGVAGLVAAVCEVRERPCLGAGCCGCCCGCGCGCCCNGCCGC